MGSSAHRSSEKNEQLESAVDTDRSTEPIAPSGLASLQQSVGGRGVTAHPAGLSPSSILALQRSAGNQAVGRAITGNAPLGVHRGILDAIGDALDMRTDEERLDAEEELEDFRNETYAPLTDHAPTSGVGLFDAAADMRAGTMTVTLKVGYNFVDGTPANVSAGFRPEEFKWDPAEKIAWKERYQREVSAMWSAQFQIRSSKANWSAMVVDTTVQVIEDSADPHFTLTVAKYPPDAGMAQSSICPPGYHHDAAAGNCAANAAGDESGTGDLDSNDLRPEQKLDWGNAVTQIPFSQGSSAMNATGTAALAPIIVAVAGKPDSHVQLTGRASSTHRAGSSPADGAIANMDLARTRTAAARAALIAGGLTAGQILVRNVGEEGATAGDEWCRVDAQVGTQEMQNPALHETGHMLGSDDEYPQTGAPAGTAVAANYDAMIQAQTGDVVTRGRNADAMSLGSTVRRWNYAAFVETLEEITGETEWTL